MATTLPTVYRSLYLATSVHVAEKWANGRQTSDQPVTIIPPVPERKNAAEIYREMLVYRKLIFWGHSA